MGERVTQSGRGGSCARQPAEKGPGERSSACVCPPGSSCASRERFVLRNSCPLPPLFCTFPEQSRKDAETRLQFLEQMFQASPDGLSIADCDHRVLWANETFVRMFGYELPRSSDSRWKIWWCLRTGWRSRAG